MRKRCSTRARIAEFLRLRFFWLPESAAPRLPPVQARGRALGLGLVLDASDHSQGARPALVFVTGVAAIAEYHLVALAQQIGQFADVGSIGGSHADAVRRPLSTSAPIWIFMPK